MSDFVEKVKSKRSSDSGYMSHTSDPSEELLSDFSSDPEWSDRGVEWRDSDSELHERWETSLPPDPPKIIQPFSSGLGPSYTEVELSDSDSELPVWSKTDLPTDHPPKIIQQFSSGPGPSYTKAKSSDLDSESLPESSKTDLPTDPPKIIPPFSSGPGPAYTEKYVVITSPEQRWKYKNDFNAEYGIYRRLHAKLMAITEHFIAQQKLLQLKGTKTDKTVDKQILKEYRKIKKTNPNYNREKAHVEYLHNKLAHIKRRITEYDESRLRRDDKENKVAPDSHGGCLSTSNPDVLKVIREESVNEEDKPCLEDPERSKQQHQPLDGWMDEALNTNEKQMFQPELSTEAGKISYRFRCPGQGVFQCKSTRLVFEMTQEADLLYGTVQWDESLLQSAGKTAAGLLFDIKCSESAAVSHLHLPHCEIIDDPLPEDLLSVVHITEDRLELLTPLEITDTHVVVKVPHFSAFGLVRDLVKWLWNNNSNKEESNTKPVSGQVLLFLGQPNPKTQRQKLNVLLLPSNIHLDEVSAQRRHSEHIEAPSTCKLVKDESYTLHCPQAIKIQPKKADFNLEFGPNYHPTFQIRLPTDTEEATLTVKDQTLAVVWEHDVDLTESRRGPPGENVPAAEKLRSVRADFVGRVSDAVLNQLLDKLLDLDIINDGEMQSVRAKPVTAEKARELIDTVWKKGTEASTVLIAALRKVDPHLSRELNLS